MYTQLGVMTKGTVIEVNVSELGMVTTGGKVGTSPAAYIVHRYANLAARSVRKVRASHKQPCEHWLFISLPSVIVLLTQLYTGKRWVHQCSSLGLTSSVLNNRSLPS